MKRTFEDCFGDEDDADQPEEENWNAPVDNDGDLKEDNRMKKLPNYKVGSHKDNRTEHSRTIVHIDLDCFYAQVEMIRNPKLRDKPLGVQQKNIIVTSNYVARAHGVGKLSYVKEALQKCPDLILVSGEDLTHYREMSYKVTDVLHRFSPHVERLGFDENYIDISHLVEERLVKNMSLSSPTSTITSTSTSTSAVSAGQNDTLQVSGHIYEEEGTVCLCGCHRRLTIGSHIAMEMRQQLHQELGLTSCAGVAYNKLLAKLVGEKHKPNDQTTVFPGKAEHLMVNLNKVRKIPGIGHTTGKRLASIGITTVQHLQDADKTVLESQFGHQQATTMQQSSHGIDNTPVTPTGAPQSISDEDSFKKCSTLSDAKERIQGMLKNLLKRLKSDGRVPQTIRLTIRKYSPKEWKRESRQCSLAPSIFKYIDKDIIILPKLLDTCIELLNKMLDTTKPFHLTLINVCFAKMQDNSKKAAHCIDNFFSPKAKSSMSRTTPSHSYDSSTTFESAIGRTVDNSKKSSHSIDKLITAKATYRPKPSTSEAAESTPDYRGGAVINLNKPSHSIDEFSMPNASTSAMSNNIECDLIVSGSMPCKDNLLYSTSRSTHHAMGDGSIQNVKDTPGFQEHSPNIKVKRGTLEAFFSSPKRNRTNVFPCGNKDFKETESNQSKQNFNIDQSQESIGGSSFRSRYNSNGTLEEPTLPVSDGLILQSSTTSKNSEKKSCCVTLPPHIDPDVFAQLPSKLQHELIVQFAADIPESRQVDEVEGQPTKHPSGILPDKPDKKSLESHYGKPSSSHLKQGDSIDHNALRVPPDVDAEVFTGLPHELQQELANEWRHSSRSHTSNTKQQLKERDRQKSNKSISDYFRK